MQEGEGRKDDEDRTIVGVDSLANASTTLELEAKDFLGRISYCLANSSEVTSLSN